MHTRGRHIEKILLKRVKMYPVVGVLGPRQVGKSTFLMSQWCQIKSANYITFDKQEVAIRAKHSPEQLLLTESNNQKKHLIIDEAQKIPHIFDSIKALVDQNRHMGAFTLSGSVEFSAKSGVRESLTGRLGISRLYPMTLRELSNQTLATPWVTFDFAEQIPIKPKCIEQWLDRGGMPIFCNWSELDERHSIINSWLEAICYRDLKQFKDAEYDSEVAYGLLKSYAVDSQISMSRLADDLGATVSSIKKHIAALESLFLLYKIPMIGSPRANPIYTIFDAGVLNALYGGQATPSIRQASLRCLLINEIYAQYEYAGKLKPALYSYRTRGGANIDLVLKTNEKLVGIDCVTSIEVSAYKQRGMKSFLKKYPDAIGYFVAPVQKAYPLGDRLFVIPWNNIG